MEALKPLLADLGYQDWSTLAKHTARVLDVVQGDLTWIIGTIYMEMPLKPQVLQDLVSDVNLSAAVPPRSWRDPRADTIQFEDESGRLTIVGHKLSEATLCTGIVVAILGSETARGDFEVIDIIYPCMVQEATLGRLTETQLERSEKELSVCKVSSTGRIDAKDDYIAIVSGLELSGTTHSALTADLLMEYLLGEVSGKQTRLQARNICTLVVLGNSVLSSQTIDDDAMTRKLSKNKKYGYDSASFDSRPIDALDAFLEELCKSIDVVLIPGETDPTNITMPQKPINKIMLRRASSFVDSSLKLSTNPTLLGVKERAIFCTAGQTIDDLKHYISTGPAEDSRANAEDDDDKLASEALNLMEESLRWGHFAPTAPDTLWTYPFSDQDPFIIESMPQIYLVGNQDHFAQRLVETTYRGVTSNCQMVLIPKFAQRAEVVLVNLRTLQTESIVFEISDLNKSAP